MHIGLAMLEGVGVTGLTRALHASAHEMAAIPHALATVSQALIAIPQALIAIPHALSAIPHALVAISQALLAIPHAVIAISQALVPTPQSLAALPHACADLSQAPAWLPRATAELSLALSDVPRALAVTWWAICGLLVGSFLNVAIHRLPLPDESVSKPRRSRCPSCKTTLTWRENVPLFSWVVQRGRCRTCGWRIPWRYPLVEALTCALWTYVALRTLPARFDVCLVQTIVLSGLVVATFVDFACFEIPDEVSIGGMVLAPIASFLVPDLHAGSPIAAWLDGPGATSHAGALLACVAGMVVGGGSLWLIGKVGSALYGRDAMGFGDVKLLAAGGGFVGPGAALAALMIASVLASIAGLANMLRFLVLLRVRASQRGRTGGFGRSAQVARAAGRYLPFGPYLAAGIGIVLLAWKDVVGLVPWADVWHH